jgi:hypothetical protein
MSTNQLANPGFETTVAPWEARSAGTALARVASASAFEGGYVGRVTSTAGGATDFQVNDQNNVPVTPGQPFVFSFRVRPNVTPRTAVAFIEWSTANFAAANGAANGTATATTVGSWTTVSVSGTVPAGSAYARVVGRFTSTAVNDTFDVDAIAYYNDTTDPTYQSPSIANAGPDQNGAPGAVATLVGTPPGGTWSQQSGLTVTLSAPVTNATDTRVTFTHANPSKTSSADRVFRYDV